jgi:hypothetical protein
VKRDRVVAVVFVEALQSKAQVLARQKLGFLFLLTLSSGLVVAPSLYPLLRFSRGIREQPVLF